MNRYNILNKEECDRRHDLMVSYLPGFVSSEPLKNEYLKVVAYEIALFNKLIVNLPRELNPKYTSLFLEEYEDFVGLPHDNDLSDEIRRTLIIAKLNAVYGVTLGFMRDLVQTFDAEGWVEEFCHLYMFEVTLRMLDWNVVSKLLDKIYYFKPAHLALYLVMKAEMDLKLSYAILGNTTQYRKIKTYSDRKIDSSTKYVLGTIGNVIQSRKISTYSDRKLNSKNNFTYITLGTTVQSKIVKTDNSRKINTNANFCYKNYTVTTQYFAIKFENKGGIQCPT